MTLHRDITYLKSLVGELTNLPKETEWVEFKHNKGCPDEIGEYISSLSNSAALHGKAHAYLLWGIENDTHEILGTTFSPFTKKVGGEELEHWLLKLTNPRINFSFFEVTMEEKRLVLLEIPRAFRHPVQFKGVEYIRVTSYQKKLKDFPELERKLWQVFDDTPFEDHLAKEGLSSDDVLKLLDYPSYFDLLAQPLPETKDSILNILDSDSMIVKADSGHWSITNLGAILFAKKLSDFRALERKAARVVLYRGDGRVKTIRERDGKKGLACDFEELISFVNSLLPSNEVIGQAIRKTVPMYPELAVRELVANAIIHQDFFITGSGPLIEIFDNRMEITNPGKPLVETARFLDSPPRSRNDALASFMRRIGVCEERGTGVDKVIFQTELYQLPAPVFEVVGDNLRAVLFAHRELREMDKADKILACYWHSCLKYVSREFMTNATLRGRFGIDSKNSALASRIIRETIEAKMIKPYDQNASKKFMKYVPSWA